MPKSRVRKRFDKTTGLLIVQQRPAPGSPRGEKLRSRRADHRDNVRAQQKAGLEWRRKRKAIKGHPRCKPAKARAAA